MWSIRFLSGPKAGREVLLQNGLVILGRDESCQISIPSKGVSKKHAQLIVKDKSVRIEDLRSSNGTFIEGKKIQAKTLREGDRAALHNVIFELAKKQPPPAAAHSPYQQPYPYMPHQGYPPGYPPGHPPGQPGAEGAPPAEGWGQPPAKPLSPLENIQKGAKGYIDDVVLPGVYKLAEIMEFKFVVGFFVIGFILVTIIFSTVPLTRILKASVEQTGKNHAKSLAEALKIINKKHIQSGLPGSLDVSYAESYNEVREAYIISPEGRVLAPDDHGKPDSFIHKARTQEQNEMYVEKIGLTNKIGASAPIMAYSAERQENVPMAYAIVIYDTSSLASGAGKTISLVTQNLFISCAIGLILFFFLINLIEFPIKSINRQFGKALKDDKASSVSTKYQSPPLSELCSHINSSLHQISVNQMMSRQEKASDEDEGAGRQSEMSNLVEIVGFPSLSVDLTTDTVAALNSNFTEQIGCEEILQSSVSDIQESGLREHIKMLIEQGRANPQEISFGEISLSGASLQTTCQIVMGKKEPAYAIVTFMPAEGEAA